MKITLKMIFAGMDAMFVVLGVISNGVWLVFFVAQAIFGHLLFQVEGSAWQS
ncbi:MAG: hypothetical protein ACYDC7_05405 [Acidithiobacillus ferrivorans]